MKDQQLYNAIQKMVEQKRQMIVQVEGSSIAEQYCQQQLARKKLTRKNCVSKMAHLLKKFETLETYVDLPELLKNIKLYTRKEQKVDKCVQQQQSNPKDNKMQKPKADCDTRFTKYFDDIKKLHYISSPPIQKLLCQVQQQSSLQTNSLKNNTTYSNIYNMLKRVKEQRDGFTSENRNKVFQMFNTFKEDGVNFQMIHQVDLPGYKETMLNSEVRKEYAMFLHKATSYLQIILEQQHRAKWEEKEKKRRKERRGEKGDRRDEGRLKYSGFRKGKGRKHTKINTEVSLASQPGASLVHLSMIQQMPSQISPSQRPPSQIPPPQIPPSQRPLSMQKNSDSQCQKSSQPHSSTKKSRQPFKPLLQSDDHRPQSADKIKTQTQAQTQTQIRQHFTFRNRSIKQNIVNKLGKFIREIDDEQYQNKKENEYYLTEINKLSLNYQRLYNRYTRSTLLGKGDLQKLKVATGRGKLWTRKECGQGEEEDGWGMGQ